MARYLSILAGAIALGAIAASNASASMITIDFESLPESAFNTTPLTISGVRFTPATGHYHIGAGPLHAGEIACSSQIQTKCLQIDSATLSDDRELRKY